MTDQTTVVEPEYNFPTEDIVENKDQWEKKESKPKTITEDFTALEQELTNMLKNPNPISFVKNFDSTKQKILDLINKITQIMIDGFSWDEESFIKDVYKSNWYHSIILNNIKYYLVDCKYFDPKFYVSCVILFDVTKLELLKNLQKLYLGETVQDSMTLEIYSNLWIQQLTLNKLDMWEDKVLEFFEQLVLNLDKETRKQLFIYFDLVEAFDETDFTFDLIYKIFKWIVHRYDNSNEYYNKNLTLKNSVDKLILNYQNNKEEFYIQFKSIISSYRGNMEYKIFNDYVSTHMIENYFPEIKNLFYWNDNFFSRSQWSEIGWTLVGPTQSENMHLVECLTVFKNLIISLNNNVLGTFLRPIVLEWIARQITISESDFSKFRYLLTILIAKSYYEYVLFYRFFNELNVFINPESRSAFNVFKIFSSLIVSSVIALATVYIYWTFRIFISLLVIIVSYFKEIFFPSRGVWILWNTWVKSFATLILVIASWIWVTNLWNQTEVMDIMEDLQKVGMYKTVDWVNKSVKVMADIFGVGK